MLSSAWDSMMSSPAMSTPLYAKQQLICQACGAKLNWDGVSDLVTCPYCGSRFNLRPRTQGAGDEVLRDGIGRGTVAQIPSVQADARGT